jgi:hypothetical protein
VSPHVEPLNRLRSLLFPPFRQAPIARAVVIVILRIDLAHRGLPRAFLVCVGDEAG